MAPSTASSHKVTTLQWQHVAVVAVFALIAWAVYPERSTSGSEFNHAKPLWRRTPLKVQSGGVHSATARAKDQWDVVTLPTDLPALVRESFAPQLRSQFPTYVAATKRSCNTCKSHLLPALLTHKDPAGNTSLSWHSGQGQWTGCASQRGFCSNKQIHFHNFPRIMLDTSWKALTAASLYDRQATQVEALAPFALGLLDRIPARSISTPSPSNCLGGEKTYEVSCRSAYTSGHGCDYRSMDVQPPSWSFLRTDQCEDFMRRCQEVDGFGDGMWVIKSKGSHGSGINIVDGVAQIQQQFAGCKEPSHTIIQRYISNPALVEGRKFDLRTYLAVVSTAPLVAFYHDGFIRRAQALYTANSSDTLGHVTNAKGQTTKKHYADFSWMSEALHAEDPATFARDFVQRELRPRAKRVLNLMLHAARVHLEPIKGRFHVFAMDWVVDASGKVWLLEGNLNPEVGVQWADPSAMSPDLLLTYMDLVRAVQMDPATLQRNHGPLLASRRFTYKGWELVYVPPPPPCLSSTLCACARGL